MKCQSPSISATLSENGILTWGGNQFYTLSALYRFAKSLDIGKLVPEENSWNHFSMNNKNLFMVRQTQFKKSFGSKISE